MRFVAHCDGLMFMRRMAGAWTGLGYGRVGGVRQKGSTVLRSSVILYLMVLISKVESGTAEYIDLVPNISRKAWSCACNWRTRRIRTG